MMMCCAAPSSGNVSIDIGLKPENKIGLSRQPSFTIIGGLQDDDTLQLVMQPSRNAPKQAKEIDNIDPKKLL